MQITDHLYIDEVLIEEKTVRASGPGGQHVNTTDSAVQLRFHLSQWQAPHADIKARLRTLAGQRLTRDGDIVLRSDRHRAQARNREAVRERLRALIVQALTPPKKRVATRPSRASVQRVKDAKARTSARKQSRRRPGPDD